MLLRVMATTPANSKRTGRRGPVLGLKWFTAISAVEGIRLTEEMRKDFEALQRTEVSPEARRAYLARKYGKRTV